MVGILQYSTLLALGVTTAFADESTCQGDGTPYELSSIAMGNCALMSSWSQASTYYAALNDAQWDNSMHCGQCIQVRTIDNNNSQNGTGIITLQITDHCPECKKGDVDMCTNALTTLVGNNPGRVKISWEYVPCPELNTIKLCLKNGSTSWWVAIQPTNTRVPVKSMSINGMVSKVLDGAYFFEIKSKTEMPLNNLKVDITSVNDEVISGTYPLTVGECFDIQKQFQQA